MTSAQRVVIVNIVVHVQASKMHQRLLVVTGPVVPKHSARRQMKGRREATLFAATKEVQQPCDASERSKSGDGEGRR